ncbi:MAG: MATE family efflux transporter, partial [Acidimicrobiia bacterium]|nr:MATE family efflux transporter [Acidimicrobiia bacterium]
IDAPTLAAHQVAAGLFGFLALVLDALAIPAQTLVAEELGRDDLPQAAAIADRSTRLSVWAAAALAVLLAAAAPLLPHAFSGDPAVVERATSALWWLAAVLLPGAVAFALDGVLIGAGDYRFLGRAAFGYLIAVAPLAVTVLAAPGLGIAGIWAGMLVWMVLRAIVNYRRAARLLPLG